MLKQPVESCQSCEIGRLGACPFVARPLRRDALVTAQGEVATEIGFVREGVLSLSSVGPSGEERRVAVRGPRTVVGLEALDGQPAAEEVRALTDATLCTSDVQRVKRWMGGASGAQSLLQLAISELALRRAEVDLRQGSADVRVARFALEYAPLVREGKGASFSKERVARMLGMRPETFSRVLRRLSDQGLIDSKRGLKVVDEAALKKLAQ